MKWIVRPGIKNTLLAVANPWIFLGVGRSAIFFFFLQNVKISQTLQYSTQNFTHCYSKYPYYWDNNIIQFEQIYFSKKMVYPKCAGEKANNVDPDQTAPWSSLIWVYTFFSGLFVLLVGVIIVNLPFRKKKKKNAVPSGQKIFLVGRIWVGR